MDKAIREIVEGYFLGKDLKELISNKKITLRLNRKA